MTQNGAGRVSFERVTTGVPALDGILEGGVPEYSLTLVAGAPGTGKTVICQQALFANARAGGRVLYLGTLSEPVIKMVRYIQRFSFFDPEMVGREVVYADLGTALARQGGDGVMAEIEKLIKQHRPEFLVIDSFKAISERFDDPHVFRKLTTDLATRLATWQVTAFFVGEYSLTDIASGAEFSVADGILYLYGTEEPTKQKRFLRVMKMRGTNYFPGEHFFEITSEGIEVFPRMAPEVIGEYRAPTGRISSRITGLSEMLSGGIPDSTSTLIIGGSGTGKTTVALSFVAWAAAEGRPALYVSFEEGAGQIVRNCQGFGWDIQEAVRSGLLDIYHVSPSELDIDRHATLFKRRADAIQAQCVVMDTATAIEASFADRVRYQNYLWAIIDYFKRTGVTVIMTYESTAQTEFVPVGTDNISFLSDVIINAKLVPVGGTFKRTLHVLKMRGNAHDQSVREFIVDPPRMEMGGVHTETGTVKA